MVIERVNDYDDPRFSPRVLKQHGCFLADGAPYEIEIVSETEAVVRGEQTDEIERIIEEFRFYSPHICVFSDANGQRIRAYEPPVIYKIPLDDIQPSQFFADTDKVNAVRDFIHAPDDIIIQVIAHEGRHISLDGHTRLYLAAERKYPYVRAVYENTDAYLYDFVREAIARGVRSPYDLKLLSHEEYRRQWDAFCDDYFARRQAIKSEANR